MNANGRKALATGTALLALAGCMDGGGTGSAGVGTLAGTAAGVGASRAIFGISTSAMLLGGAAGGLAGNMALDRPTEERRRQEAMQDRQISQQMQLDFQRQQALQAEQTRIEIEEKRLFQQWQRDQARA